MMSLFFSDALFCQVFPREVRHVGPETQEVPCFQGLRRIVANSCPGIGAGHFEDKPPTLVS